MHGECNVHMGLRTSEKKSDPWYKPLDVHMVKDSNKKNEKVMNRRIMLCMVVLMAACSVSVFAQTGDRQRGARGMEGREKPSPEKIMERLDVDKNQAIDKSEAANAKGKMLTDRFDEIDANNNGTIDLNELTTAIEARGEKRQDRKDRFAELDTNNDGMLSKAEVDASGHDRLIENFAKIDTDGNGSLSEEELKAVKKKRRGKKG